MRKSERKANTKLAEAQKYVASYKLKPTPVMEPTPAAEPAKAEIRPKGSIKVENAEIKKLQKGYFFVVVTYGGKQKYEIQKRFKSTTRAQEWINKHKYLTL